jgi:hypothetical protein
MKVALFPAAALANTIRCEALDAAVVILGRFLGRTREPPPVAHGDEFGRLIAGSRVEERTYAWVTEFLG